jgi:phytoene synthase
VDAIVDNSRTMIRKGSKSFSAAARLFDESTRESAYMLYAWCRHCDDVIDGQDLGFGAAAANEQGAEERLTSLYEDTRRVLAGEPADDPVFQALQRVVERHRIPARYPLELLEGFAMDVRGHRYDSLDDTLLYCYHVAGVVGVMMAYVMGVREKQTLRRASDMGIALQLTNISRDVMEDAGVGRVYLPAEWLAQAGVPANEIASPEHRSAVFSVVGRLLDEADRYYDSAYCGLPDLGFRSAWAIATARGVYRDIGGLVRNRGAAAWDERAVVSRPRKAYWALRGLAQAIAAVSVRRMLASPPREGLWTKPDPAAGP